MKTRGKSRDRKERERKLDQAIEMTFPASDPIAVGPATGTEQAGRPAKSEHKPGSLKPFAVGLKIKGRAEHVLVDAEDALIAALRIKAERPEALIMYVRPQNRRGDARHPPRPRSKARSE